MPRRLLSAAAAGALLLGLAACGETTDGPVTTPPPSIDIGSGPSDNGGADPSDGGGEESPEPTADAPDIPPPDPADYAGMDEHTEEGAEQAFRYYIAVSMWAHQTGDDALLTTLQSDTCDGCEVLNAELPKLQQADRYWSKFDVTDVRITPHESENFEYEIGYSFTVPAHTRPDLDSGGRVDINPVEYITVGGMTWTNEGWVVGGINSEWGPDVHE